MAPALRLIRRTFLQGASAALAAGFAPGSVLLGKNAKTNNVFAILPEDLQGHMHIIGASGKGKSNFLEVLLRQHVLQADGVSRGLCILDPHGSVVERLTEWIADNRVASYKTVRVIDAADAAHSFSFNPFSSAAHFDPATLAELMAKATMQAWGADRLTDTPRLATVLTETFYALAVNRATLLDAVDLLRAEDPHGLRRHFVEQLPNEVSRSFWEDLEGIAPARRHELLESTWSRLRPFLRSPAVRRVFAASEQSIDLRAAMDAGELVLISLRPNEHLSPEAARLIGTLLVTSFYTEGFRRKRPELPFYLFLDEAQLFLTPDIARILDQSRKHGIRLCLSHQHLGHLREAGEAIMRSVLTNCRVRAVFGGLDADDARFMARNVFRGQWGYERPKRGFLQPMVVGVRRTLMTNGSQSRGTSRSIGESTGVSRSVAHSQSTTQSWSVTNSSGESVAEGWSEADTDGTSSSSSESYRSDRLLASPGSTTEGLAQSKNSSSGRSGSLTTTTGQSVTEGESITAGRTETEGWSRSRTVAAGTSRQVTQGFSEAFEPIYAMRPTQLLSVEEQIQQRADALARLPVGQMWVQIADRRPRRIKVAYLGEEQVLPALMARVRDELLAATPYVRSAQAAEAAHLAYRERLLEGVKPAAPEPRSDEFERVAAKLKRRRKADDGDT